MATDTSTLTPAEWQAMLAENATDKPAARPALTPLGAPPAAPSPAPSAAPALPTVGAGNIPDLAKPTRQQSNAAGKSEYQAGLPQVTAKPFTPEWAQQQEELAQYKHLHPLGSDVSAMPGVGGKFLHGLSRVANIAGDVLAPGVTMNIPGSDLYNRGQEKLFRNEFTTGQENEERGARTKEIEEGNELVPFTNPATGETSQIERRQWAPLGAAEIKGDTARDVAGMHVGATDRKTQEAEEAMYRSHGLKKDPNGGPPIPIPESELSPRELLQNSVMESMKKYHDAEAALDAAKNDPNSPQYKLAQERLQIAKGELSEKWASLNVQKQKVAAEGERTNKDALKSFNKDYKVPADKIEQSYQMMDNAYQEYKAAKAKGEELPTGAQSMVALSTHLATTFGNVKGARITKDMIEHHIGARGVSDAALVAIQKLTNGDVLSPQQWEAFHDLIGKSRELTWHAATREADRAGVPLDFLPDDLQGKLGEGAAYTPTHANPKGPAGGAGAPPPGAKIVPLDQFLKGPQ